MFLSKGVHSIKIGFSYEGDLTVKEFELVPGGQFAFASLTNLLTNVPRSFSAGLPVPSGNGSYAFRQSVIGGYIQDDVRWRPNLTFNLGLRYEMATVPYERNGKLANMPTLTATAPTVGPIFKNPTLRNFEPRIGIAWDPFGNGKTSVRSSFGIFDSLPLSYQWSTSIGQEAPFAESATVTTGLTGKFPAGAYPLLIASPPILRAGHVDPNPPRSYVMQWNLNVQRQLFANLAASVAYIGSRGVHLANPSGDSNIKLPTLTSAGYLFPATGTVLNPAFSRIDYMDWRGDSYYDAFQAQVTKNFSRGFQAQGSYTWAKSIDKGSSLATAATYANSVNYGGISWVDPNVRRGLSDFNVGQSLTVNYNWTLPNPHSFLGPATWVARGWQLGGIFQAQTGFPFTAIIGGDALGQKSLNTTSFPNRLIGPGCESGVNPGDPVHYIKSECFALQTATPDITSQCVAFTSVPTVNGVKTCANLLGNEGRNSLIGPGVVNFDFSVFKNNYIPRISESFNVQFRAEFFNVLNHTNFSSPTANNIVFNQNGTPVPGAGLITATSTNARQIQFALKVIW
jgi:hypothetical protein